MFELLSSASVVVDDIPAALRMLVEAIGLGEPKPRWYAQTSGLEAVFCRVHPDFGVAPTRLELVQAGPVWEDRDPFPVAEIAAKQGERPIKVHATAVVLPLDDLKALGRHLEETGIPHWYFGPSEEPRLVVSEGDEGFFFEAIPTHGMRAPREALDGPADVPEGAAPHDMVRIVAREWLVEDLDATLELLATVVRWEPDCVSDESGCRRAVMPFTAPRSARLELVEPTGPGRVRDALDRLGAGAWTIRIAVVDLRAKQADLDSRGTRYRREPGALRVDPAATLQVPIEFVPA